MRPSRLKRLTVLVLAPVFLTFLLLVSLLRPDEESYDNNRNDKKIGKDGQQDREKIFDRAGGGTSTPAAPPLLPDYRIHVFYYAWYGNPQHDGKYLHWNHRYLPGYGSQKEYPKVGRRHVPPADIGSSFYPVLGAYSSRDVAVVRRHMKDIREAGIGVLAVSWYPPGMHDAEGEFSDSVLPLILDEAMKFNLKVCLHVEPFEGRNESSMRSQLEYIISRYGPHPALYRMRSREGKHLPLYYIYDSYLTSSTAWARLLGPPGVGDISVRGTGLDGIFLGLLLGLADLPKLREAGFNGFYTYFGSDGVSFGSDFRNWFDLSSEQSRHDLLFVPSVSPGYSDVCVRPWNAAATRDREGGAYYNRSFRMAVDAGAHIISITSFNEWHEGTQIESAQFMEVRSLRYLDYWPHLPDFYLRLTKELVQVFSNSWEKRPRLSHSRKVGLHPQ